MTSSNSTSTTEETPSEGQGSESKKSRAALYSDNMRLNIIEEIYKRKFLWDSESRESMNMSPTTRRQAFAEIASQLSSQSPGSMVLKGEDVERQFKNLKDTYVKIRKKLQKTGDGTPGSPKWRFYKILQFIDSDDKVVKALNFNKELAILQTEQQKSTSSNSNTSSQANQTVTTMPNDLNVSNLLTTTAMHPQSSLTRLKRNQDTQLTYVRHDPNHIGQGEQCSSKGLPRPSTMNGILNNGLNGHDDEYVIFCHSLIPSFREIGTHDKLEFIKLQKTIHDAVFEIQSRIHSNGSNRRPK